MSAAVTACPLCMGGAARSPAQDLADLSRAVLATPVADGKSYRVVDVIKGARPEGDRVTDVVIREPASLKGGKPLLLVRDEAWPMWTSLGAVGGGHAAVLRAVAAKRPADADLDGWRARVDSLVPYLESAEPLLAEIAYAECAARAVRRVAVGQASPERVGDPPVALRIRALRSGSRSTSSCSGLPATGPTRRGSSSGFPMRRARTTQRTWDRCSPPISSFEGLPACPGSKQPICVIGIDPKPRSTPRCLR